MRGNTITPQQSPWPSLRLVAGPLPLPRPSPMLEAPPDTGDALNDTSPVPALVAIVVLSVLTLCATVVLIATGNKDMVAPMGGLILPVIMALIGIKIQLVKAQLARRAAIEAASVKSQLAIHNTQVAEQMADLKETASQTHTLVNNNMLVQLRLNAELSRWKANHTGLAKDIEAANLADRRLREQEARQAKVDDAGGLRS